VVIGTESDNREGRYFSAINSKAALATFFAFEIRYDVPIVFASSPLACCAPDRKDGASISPVKPLRPSTRTRACRGSQRNHGKDPKWAIKAIIMMRCNNFGGIKRHLQSSSAKKTVEIIQGVGTRGAI